eukprot:TRINITY_DN55372_c0_g1_i1.p1 TRINITY_DN55372_c0_g1~~TRINITY_DN55372_c0_g1_i1.p1  ORF type:complete len:406 (+),score=47.80 TRINITY_DN55372_c0_g1_i1:42-1259(+)
MAGAMGRFGNMRRIPFAFYRSGTSRGLYLLESDIPPKGPDRDAVLCKLMGSGHPQQLEGFGGGCGPTSKAVIVGNHPDSDGVTYTFAQCKVEEAEVDHSHGDCGNMLAAVAPFALERGLVKFNGEKSGNTHVRIHSLNTGAVYAANVCTFSSEGDGSVVRYEGDLALPGVPNPAAPVVLTTFGIAGSQTGKFLPTGNSEDQFDLGAKFGMVSVTIVDFARALIMLDAHEVLPLFGISSMAEATKQRIEANVELCAALERVRRAASLAMGMGDCAGKDAPKVALLSKHAAETEDASAARLNCRYFVNPERSEMHPTVAMTAAQAIAAACLVDGSIARRLLSVEPALDKDDAFSLSICHPKGLFPVTVGTEAASHGADARYYPQGFPSTGKYTTTVLPIAEGNAFVV